MNIKKAQAALESSCVYDSFDDLQTSIEWLKQDTEVDELRNRIYVALDEANALIEGLYEVRSLLEEPDR